MHSRYTFLGNRTHDLALHDVFPSISSTIKQSKCRFVKKKKINAFPGIRTHDFSISKALDEFFPSVSSTINQSINQWRHITNLKIYSFSGSRTHDLVIARAPHVVFTSISSTNKQIKSRFVKKNTTNIV